LSKQIAAFFITLFQIPYIFFRTGVLSNMFVLMLSLFSVRGDYRLFIANLALVDSLCGIPPNSIEFAISPILALLYAFMGLLWSIGRPLQRQIPLGILTQSALCFYGSFGVLVAALLPVSFSRIVAAWWPKHYEKVSERHLFKKKTIEIYLRKMIIKILNKI